MRRDSRAGVELADSDPARPPTANPHDRTLQDRVRAMAQLVAGILHEFNSPLGALRASIDTARAAIARLVDAMQRDPIYARRVALQLDEVLVIARSATDRIVGSIETLSHFARVDRADVDDVDLAQIIETALRLSGALRNKSLRVERTIEPGLRVRCRVREIEHVLYHVIRNADEALAGRGNGVIRIEARRADSLIEIVVRDNGHGIDPDKLATLFEPSLTTKGSTVGLGMSLATCRYIAEEHGGTLQAENSRDGGAAFTLRFAELSVLG
jgi:two-component system C4-dicarboxylate transport sensor histidine kinase DctB